MRHRHWAVLATGVIAAGVALATPEDKPKVADAPKTAPVATAADKYAPSKAAPKVAGAWAGTWGPFNPAQAATVDQAKCKVLDCVVVEKDGIWQATFEGECGRPYKYTIKMDGRQAGGAVLFKGSPDLGPKDGGVYDWVGRATDTEFVGFYTSSNYTGVFQLKRAKPATP
jgi:hypothetical protein